MKKGLSVRRTAMVAVLTLASAPAVAGKLNAVVNGKSYHFNSTYQWNEDNYGLGLEHEFTQKNAWRWTAMANGFRDSTDNMSYMAGAGLYRRIFETEKLAGFYIYTGINAFLMTRDDVDDSKPFPGILPSVTIGNDKIGFNLAYMPTSAIERMTSSYLLDPTLSGVLFLQLKFNMEQLLP